MPKLRREKRTIPRPKRRRWFALMLASFCMAVGVAQLQLASWPQPVRIAVLIACFGVAVALGAYFTMGNILGGYRCQECGARCRATISPLWAKDGDPVRYLCRACDIEWDTGGTYSTPNN
jgi:hypothetical protein